MFAKLQGHWIIEMSEMLATSNAKSIEEIRSFISRQKETYRTPYESQPKEHPPVIGPQHAAHGGAQHSQPPPHSGGQLL